MSKERSVLVVGGGAREHALGWRLRRDVRSLCFAPGNAGTRSLGWNENIDPFDIERLTRFAVDNAISLTVVGPEAPLAAGIVDAFTESGLFIFGPTQKAARLETDKAWAIGFMQRHNIPHPPSWIFHSAQTAIGFVETRTPSQIVIKASGLAGGKGVFLPKSHEEAVEGVKQIMAKKVDDKGDCVVIQERLHGRELSIFALSDGETVKILPAAQDYKRALDNNEGPNTGGMGSYAPVNFADHNLMRQIEQTILLPTIKGMREGGIPYKGVLYAGLMITSDGPSVLEFNARFGDPETQPLMLLFDSDLYEALFACTNGTLNQVRVAFKRGSAICIVLAAEGYPENPKTGKTILGLDLGFPPDIQIFHAGTRLSKKGQVVTNGGRVLGVTAYGERLAASRAKAYSAIGKKGIHFDGMQYRKDIGKVYN